MIDSGLSFSEVARHLLLDDDSIRRFVKIYQEWGVSGLMTDDYRGGAPLLKVEEQEILIEHLRTKIYLSAKEICEWVRKKFKKEYKVSGMTNLLHRLNFSYKKPKIVPGKGNPIEQEKFIKEYHKIKRVKADEDQIYFGDGCHPLLNPIAGYGWIEKGVEMEIASNTGRQRINLNGAYNPENGEAIIIESEQINAQSTIELLEKIKKKQPYGRIIFIPDNARYYRSKLVQEYLKNNPRIWMKFLPPYSPNLNLIERLWHFYKKKVLYNTHYPTLDHMREATWNFFDGLKKFRNEIMSLITENFQIIRPNFSKTWRVFIKLCQGCKNENLP